MIAIIAYSRQSDSRLSSRVQKLTGWILAYMGLSILVGWIESIALSVKNPGLAVQQDRMLEHLASINAFEETWFLVHCLVFGIASLFLGMLGLLWARAPTAGRAYLGIAKQFRTPGSGRGTRFLRTH